MEWNHFDENGKVIKETKVSAGAEKGVAAHSFEDVIAIYGRIISQKHRTDR